MKKTITILSVLAVLFFLSPATAQKKEKPFEGLLTYTYSSEGRELDAQEKANMPSGKTIYIKGRKSREEQNTPMGNIVTISDGETQTNMVLLDILGQKIVVKSLKEDLEKGMKELSPLSVNITSDTKVIAGYNCKKAEVTQDGKTRDIYFTEEIPITEPNWNTQYKDIKGVLVDFTQPTADENLILRLTLKEVKKQKVKDLMFTVPDGYIEKTAEELRSLFGG
jgi:hypothetical protein